MVYPTLEERALAAAGKVRDGQLRAVSNFFHDAFGLVPEKLSYTGNGNYIIRAQGFLFKGELQRGVRGETKLCLLVYAPLGNAYPCSDLETLGELIQEGLVEGGLPESDEIIVNVGRARKDA
jgi:hypothetical protein